MTKKVHLKESVLLKISISLNINTTARFSYFSIYQNHLYISEIEEL